MSVNLQKGNSINLSKATSTTLTSVKVGLGWVGKNGRNLDLDSFIVLKDAQGKVINFIYFGNKLTDGVRHNGDDLVGGGSATSINESIDIILKNLKPEVVEIITGLVIYSGASSLKQVDSAFIDITNQDKVSLVRYNIKNEFSGKGVLTGTLIRKGADWEFKAESKSLNMSFNQIQCKFSKGNTPSFSSSSSSSGGSWFENLIDFITDLF
jgi:stress response protein SCP2